MKITLFVLFSMVSIMGTSSQVASKDPKHLYGRWSEFELLGDITRYRPASAQDDHGPWLEFQQDGVLLVRQNAGWCGTPPVSYKIYTGTYAVKHDSLTLKHGFWGGEMEQYYEIVALGNGQLDLRYLGMKTP